jgi:uncharacterized membrane protein (DUF373 family)
MLTSMLTGVGKSGMKPREKRKRKEEGRTMAERLTRWLHQTEKVIYFAIGIVLAASAFVLLFWSLAQFAQLALEGNIGEAVLRTLDSLLLVLMLAEILNTVEISLQGQVLKIEPFMIVGIIAAVRRILIVTAEQANPSAEHAIEFQMAMLELGILTVMILALVGAVAITRKFIGRQETEYQPPEAEGEAGKRTGA